jgi:hypothetical protein
MYVANDQFTHFSMIYSKYGATQVTKLSNEDILRVHEQPGVIASDRDRLHFPIFEIKYGSGFAGHDFTWMPTRITIHGSRFSPYRYFNLQFQERSMQIGDNDRTVMIRVAQHQHGGSFLRLAWDPMISVLDRRSTELNSLHGKHSKM